ncbi:metal dependent phosphohydrolase [Paenibacillus mucilaginosus KNP414]|nr:metal dependent phosphohydrolase [Paenibacillus mucilaginosus KNP414]
MIRMESHFFAYLYRLRFIERWSLMRNTMKENVAEHSFHVSLLTHVLCTIANEVYGRQVPTDKVVSMALFHDSTEVFTGDIPTPVKHHNPKILSNFREIEHLAAERLLDMVPEPLRRVYEPLIDPKKTTEDAELKKYIKAADSLDAYLKCVTELSAGNREFAVAKKQIEDTLQEMAMPEVDYFLKHLAPSLEKTLDEL